MGAGGSAPTCKRGIAANTAPGAAFFPAVRWWYDWSLTPSGGDTGIEFVPMIWGSSTLDGAIPAGARYLLGFNEPNFMSQANLTPQAAAAAWPMLQANGRKAGVAAIVGPAMNFCGPAASCNGTDPYVYLIIMFSVHWRGATGHVALWNGLTYREPHHDDYSTYVDPVDPRTKTYRGEFWSLI